MVRTVATFLCLVAIALVQSDAAGDKKKEDKGKESPLSKKYPKTIKEITAFVYEEIVDKNDELGTKVETKKYLQQMAGILNRAEKSFAQDDLKGTVEDLTAARTDARLQQLIQESHDALRKRDPKIPKGETFYRLVWGKSTWTVVTLPPPKK